jgi:predicted RNase H-like HicB family nuclease
MKRRYLVIIEKTNTGYCAYTPDLPGCVAVAPSLSQVQDRIHDTVRMHIDALEEAGLPIPTSAAIAEFIVV